MDDHPDPISQFFPNQDPDSVNLYVVLGLDASELKESITSEQIKKAYRRLALLHHPDKHSSAAEDKVAAAVLKFQQISFAYGVLSDDARRRRYDATGRTDETTFGPGEGGEGGWEAYFEDLFDRLTAGKLDEMKKSYQGSEEELEDLRAAYLVTQGSIAEIINHIPFSTHEDEKRFIAVLDPLIPASSSTASHSEPSSSRPGVTPMFPSTLPTTTNPNIPPPSNLPYFPAWKTSKTDEKARKARKTAADKEAQEAEEHAKELGVWDEFYGSGKKGTRKTGAAAGKGKGKGKGKETDVGGGEEDTTALQALILKRQQTRAGATASFLDGLAAKYGAMDEEEQETKKSGKGKKRGRKDRDEEDEEAVTMESPKKRTKKEPVKSRNATRRKVRS